MKRNDTVYMIHHDHICRCTVKGMQEDMKGDLYYALYSHYTRKEIDFLVPEHYVFESLEHLTITHMNEHYEIED